MVDNDTTSNEPSTRVSRRRFLGAAGATGITLGVAGCTGDGDGGQDINPTANIDEDVTIQISMDGDFANLQGKISTALSDAGLDDNISIKILPGDFETGARRSSFQSALDANRSSPDIFMMDSGWTIPFIVREQVVNLENALTSDTLSYIKDSYLPATVDTASSPDSGDLFGLPLFPDYPMMHYRKDLVKEAGYDPEGNNWATEPMSWKEFADMAKDVWDQNGGPDGDQFDYGFTTQGDNYEGTSCCTFNEMMTSFGGAYFGKHENLFGPVGERPITVDEQPVIDTIKVMRSFMHGPDANNAHPDYPQISNSDIVEFTEEPSRQPFTQGNAIFHRNWPYAVPINLGETDTDPAFDPGDYDVMPLPYGVKEDQGKYEATGGTSHALGGWHLTLNPNSENLSAAAQVLEAFANKSVMETLFREGGYIPPVPSVTKNADEETAGVMFRFKDTLAVAGQNTVPRPVTVVWPDESPLISDAIHTAYTGGKSPSKAMSDLVGELEDAEDV
ncbi:MAG: substrate-binding domain-containing protein [Halobacteriales archaeon]